MTTPSSKNLIETLSIDEWDRIVLSIVKRYFALSHVNHMIDIEDLKQEAWHALMRACKNHDPEKAAVTNVKFSTYAYAYIDGQIRRYIVVHCDLNSRTKHGSPQFDQDDLFDQIVADPNNDLCTDDELAKEELGSKLFELAKDEKHYSILVRHFVDGKTYREIGKELGVTHALIGQRIHAMLANIQEKLDDNNY